MVYFYARVSSKEQDLARQMEVADKFKKPDRIFFDKQSGKNFERPAYKEMFSLLQRGDEVVIKELDRLGRDKEGIKNEIKKMKDIGVTLRILDMPTTLSDFAGQSWVQDMVNGILIEVMASMAQQEREKIGNRRDEGIAAMPVIDGKRFSVKKGHFVGRPSKDVDILRYVELNRQGKMSVSECCESLGISRSTWYAKVKEVA